MELVVSLKGNHFWDDYDLLSFSYKKMVTRINTCGKQTSAEWLASNSSEPATIEANVCLHRNCPSQPGHPGEQ
jgi:hypothetical protein